MDKTKINRYKITVEEVQVKEDRDLKTVEFEIEDREDLLKIVEGLKEKSDLDDTDATRLGVSIRLLGPLMMKERKHPLFINFMPAFKDFMLNLKKSMKG